MRASLSQVVQRYPGRCGQAGGRTADQDPRTRPDSRAEYARNSVRLKLTEVFHSCRAKRYGGDSHVFVG